MWNRLVYCQSFFISRPLIVCGPFKNWMWNRIRVKKNDWKFEYFWNSSTCFYWCNIKLGPNVQKKIINLTNQISSFTIFFLKSINQNGKYSTEMDWCIRSKPFQWIKFFFVCVVLSSRCHLIKWIAMKFISKMKNGIQISTQHEMF